MSAQHNVTETTCRTCGERIVFLRSPVTGKAAPIELEVRPGGNVRIFRESGVYAIVPPAKRRECEAALGEEFHYNHFARCLSAKAHAKTSRGKNTRRAKEVIG